MSIEEKIVSIIAAQALRDATSLTLDSTIEDIGLDSLGLVEAIFSIEEAFDITVPFNANEPEASPEFTVSTLGDLIQSVENLIAQKSK